MKLESFEIREAITTGDLYGAARILLRHFQLPHIETLPNIRKYMCRDQTTELNIWINDDWFAWHSSSGFTTGSPDYHLYDYDVLQVYVTFWHPAGAT